MAINSDFTATEVKPVTASYFKPQVGDNDIRIISNIVSGYEAWYADDEGSVRPSRQKRRFTNAELANAKDNSQKVFCACVVHDYRTGLTSEWIFTQQTIILSLQALHTNSKWGNLKQFDITIKRTGEGMLTKYSVTPNPKEDFPHADDYENFTECVEAVFEGKPLFTMDEPIITENTENLFNQ